MDLPRITVIGGQSAGKRYASNSTVACSQSHLAISSLVEAVCGVSYALSFSYWLLMGVAEQVRVPRDSGTCTRYV